MLCRSVTSASPDDGAQIWRLLEDSPPEQASSLLPSWRTEELEPHSPEQYFALRDANIWDRGVRTAELLGSGVAVPRGESQEWSIYPRATSSAGTDGRADSHAFESSEPAKEESHGRVAGDLFMPIDGNLSSTEHDLMFLTHRPSSAPRPPSSGADNGTVYDYIHSPIPFAQKGDSSFSSSSNLCADMVLLNSGWRTNGRGRVVLDSSAHRHVEMSNPSSNATDVSAGGVGREPRRTDPTSTLTEAAAQHASHLAPAAYVQPAQGAHTIGLSIGRHLRVVNTEARMS